MIERDGAVWRVTVPMLTENARALHEAGCALFPAPVVTIDLSAVSAADSSALAVMLGWQRKAQEARSDIRFTGLPSGVQSLARLYGVLELLPQA